MEPVNQHTISMSLTAWVHDFQKDHHRLPESLDDLAANQSPGRDYNIARFLSRLGKLGFTVRYTRDDSGAFNVSVEQDNPR